MFFYLFVYSRIIIKMYFFIIIIIFSSSFTSIY